MKILKQNFMLFLFAVIFASGVFYFECKNKTALCFSQTATLTQAENYKIKEKEYEYNFLCNGKNYQFIEKDFKLNLSSVQKKYFHNHETLNKLYCMNFSKEEAVCYVFPELKNIFSKLTNIFEKKETEDEVLVVENKCKLEFFDGKKGKCINKIKFFNDLFESLIKGENKIKINLEILEYRTKKNVRKLFCEKSCFSTNFSSSSAERKNNIRVALKSLDGLIVDEGEIFSFNEITGVRNQENGYSEAKIISNGTFVNGFGGGVCQVSTTLYNACLLSNLEIIEATSHSLPVSYVEPSFDAMVSFGSSDLKIRNNSGGKIIITTSSENDVCKVKIFGLKNKYKITRQSEKVSIISAEPEIIETNYLKYGDFNLEIGEEKRLSYSKDGFISKGYLNFYDETGKLVERKQIRENKYNATKGIVLRREN